MKLFGRIGRGVLGVVLGLSFIASRAYADDADFKSILQNGLLGAGVGAISAGASGGKAGKGALIGAGTNVLGSALLGFLGSSSSSSRQQPVYAQPVSYYSAPQPVQVQPVYVEPTYTYYSQPATTSYYTPQEDPNKKIIKQGLLGAGVGAISAGTSGGNAGTGAMVGAGTNVLGGAVLDFLTTPSAAPQQASYYTAPSSNANYGPSQGSSTLHKKRVVRKFDANGKIISEEEFWE